MSKPDLLKGIALLTMTQIMSNRPQSLKLGTKMKDLASELLFKVLKTPAVAEQVRKSLVNRDISVTIDGKEYQILSKKASEDEVDKLKIQNYDLRQELSSLAEAVVKFVNNDINITQLREATRKAKDFLGEP